MGPDKLPQVARQAGALWHSLRTLQQRVEDEIREVAPDLPRSSDLVRYARSPVSLLNQLADKAKAEAATALTRRPTATADGPSAFTLPTTSQPGVHGPRAARRSRGATPPSTDGAPSRTAARAAHDP